MSRMETKDSMLRLKKVWLFMELIKLTRVDYNLNQ